MAAPRPLVPLPTTPAPRPGGLPRARARTAAPVVAVGLLGAVSVVGSGRWELGLVLLLVQCLPLAARERFPLAVLIVTGMGTLAQLLVGLPPSNAFLGQAVALTVLVRRTAWPRSLWAPVVVLAANVAAMAVTGVDDVGRLALIQAVSFGLAWALGDASARRVAIERSARRAIESRQRTADLRTEVGAAAERLRIARELQVLAGAGLRTIARQAEEDLRARSSGRATEEGAARIERAGRGVLAELDRFLSLLRSRPAPAVAGQARARSNPTTVSPSDAQALVPTARLRPIPRHLAPVTMIVPVAALGALIVVDGLTTDMEAWPTTGGVLLYAAAASLPLLGRRRAPVLTAVALTVASAVPLALGLPVADGPFGLVLAAYSVASWRSRRMAIVAAAGSVATITALAAVVSPPLALQLGLLLAVFTAVGVFLGDTARLTRAHDARLAGWLSDVQEQDRLRTQAAVAAERARAARDLHDSVGHALSLIVLQAGAVRVSLASGEGDSHRVRDALAAIEDVARRALTQLDTLLADGTQVRGAADRTGGSATIRPTADPRDAATSPEAALRALVSDVRAAGLAVDLAIGDLGDLPASLRQAVFRVVQEALTNVLKHASGARTTVSVVREAAAVRVTVRNSPTRAAPRASLPSGSRGLAGMRERVDLFAGTLDCLPEPDGGFRVEATFPFPVHTVTTPAGADP